MIDCLIIGQHDPDFARHLQTLRVSFGRRSGAYQDQDLTFILREGRPHRALDLLNAINGDLLERPLSNMDFLWPTIMVLGSFLHKHGMSFHYVNEYKQDRGRLAALLKENTYRLIAITTTLYVTDAPIKEIISDIRASDQTTPIILGGPYIKNRLVGSDQAMVASEFDRLGGDIYVNSSEGQQALVNVVAALRAGEPLGGVPNLIYRESFDGDLASSGPDRREGRVAPFVFTSLETEYNVLDSNPLNYDLFPREDIGRFLSISTAKSCPYACAFCGFPSRAGEYTYLDVDAVEIELDRIKALGVETLTFLDDTFNVPKPRFKEMLRMMIRNRYHFKWNSFYRSDQGDEETILLMADAGCEGVFLGIESANDEMLKMMSKTSRRRHYEAAIPAFRENGVYTHANFIVGFPGETEATALETLQFIKDFQPDTYKSQLWYADNTSPVWKRREELGITGYGFSWSHGTMSSDEAVVLVDRMHREITHSAFLPQEGFGMWTIFYLQRQGMSREQVLRFLKAFNTEVLRRRSGDGPPEVTPAVFADLQACGRIQREPVAALVHV